MSGRRSRASRQQNQSGSSSNEDQIEDLIGKLHRLVPELRRGRNIDKMSANRILHETCNYIRNLHREVDDLSEKLSQLLETIDGESPQASIIRSLLM
ncbi:Transcription factor PRE5-like protein [Drosera capensis]